jgi:hypothetical protein
MNFKKGTFYSQIFAEKFCQIQKNLKNEFLLENSSTGRFLL